VNDTHAWWLLLEELVKRRYNRATMWNQLEDAAKQQQIAPDKPKQRRRRPQQSGPSFVNGW